MPLEPNVSNRRSFLSHTVGLAAPTFLAHRSAYPVLGENTSSRSSTPAAAARKTSNIRIGIRINQGWMNSKNDNDLLFLKQIGVNHVDITLNLIKGYREHGIFTKDNLRALIRRLDGSGLVIERANSLGSHYLHAHLHDAQGQREIDHLKRIGDMLSDCEIPVYGIQACQAASHVENSRGGWVYEKGRGGYRFPSFNVKRSLSAAPTPKYLVTAEQLWKGLLNIYRQVLPHVEGSKTNIAMHGNDPPLYNYLGNPQILCRFADFDRLFSEVPSSHNGITFCVGTRYESGQNILDGIRHFGNQGQLFHIHFRNVIGTLPKDSHYSEVFIDDGNIPMPDVLRTLHEVGYQGVIDYDHPMGITGDEPLPKQYVSFCVGYMRGLLQSLDR